jgi:hypothetical protein
MVRDCELVLPRRAACRMTIFRWMLLDRGELNLRCEESDRWRACGIVRDAILFVGVIEKYPDNSQGLLFFFMQ